jgi:hypothetical protein
MMLDRLLEIGSMFDGISPTVAFIQDILNGPSHTFLIPEACGWSGRQIERLLKGNGIRVWGLMIVNRTIMLTVRQAQARWAQYLLDRDGIPVETPYGGGGPRSQHKRKRKRTTTLESASNLLDDLAKKIGF